jgi:predicted RNA binding protein YcfA (HicA-like mRNA interferase family)
MKDAKGSPEYWHHPNMPGTEIVITRHPSKEIITGLATNY